jgi:lipoprotein-anchoring transpeptidase ErfK/SrfK
MFAYHIKTGSIYDGSNNFLGTGYSGAGKTFEEGRNNINRVKEAGIGPVPPGKYRIEPARSSDRLGPIVMNLVPLEGTDTFGRSLFRIHGDNASSNASHGCIILGKSIREIIAAAVALGENVLEVTAE